MIRVRSFVVLAGALLVAGCAAQSPATSTGTGAGRESVAPASPAMARVPSAAPHAEAAHLQSTSAKIDVTRGYTRTLVNGRELFCRSEAITGMRINQKVCFTEQELESAQQNTQQLMQGIERQTSNGKPLECRSMGSTAPC